MAGKLFFLDFVPSDPREPLPNLFRQAALVSDFVGKRGGGEALEAALPYFRDAAKSGLRGPEAGAAAQVGCLSLQWLLVQGGRPAGLNVVAAAACRFPETFSRGCCCRTRLAR